MRWLRPFLTFLIPAALLLPVTGTSQPKGTEAPWREGGWTGAFAVPRPTLPGRKAFLEAAGPIPTNVRVRIHRVDDPAAFLKDLLSKGPGTPAFEGGRAGRDPLDTLREAFLWGGRRAFVTVHRTATRALRDVARQSDRLHQGRSGAISPREGEALPLENQPGLSFVSELVPRVTEEITRKKDASRGEDEGYSDDESGDTGHLSRVELPAQAAGVYLLEVLRGEDAAYVPWLVTDLALLGEQDGGRLRVQAVSAVDGALRGGVSGQFYEGTTAKALSFSADGKAETAATPGVRRVVVAQAGGSVALLAIEGQASASVRQRLYAFTERPLYRPGQEVFEIGRASCRERVS
jgi:hypothetical protein